ncbi:transporter [Prevotella herbatica]|uniref:Transporter n=1 Tax=Prevotella herbatica TaxID=2801997 RepID=A0ABN6EKU8_9BACT|nr:TolC family protein [Prevotella herbatica]BCS84748.1 transporter [Prevotella herbatica]
MRIRMILLGLIMATTGCYAQLTLLQCRQKAHDNYPLIKQYDLVERLRDYNIANASVANLPQVSVTGLATYHTDMLKGNMASAIDTKSYLYGGMLQVSQNVYDGGAVSSRKSITKADANVSTEQLNVSMYDVNSRVDQMFFGTLLLDEQIKQNKLLQEDLALSRKSIDAMMKNGIANQSDIDAIKVEQLNAEQQMKSLIEQRHSYIMMLAIFIDEKIDDNITLSRPSDDMPESMEVKRPEMKLFDAQTILLNEREKALDVNLKPKFGLFVSGLVGNTGLDLINKSMLMAGAKLTWNIGGLYTRKNDKRQIEANRQQIESNRQTFLFNTRLQTVGETSVINDLKEKIKTDDDIVVLRTNIRSKAERKVENGTLTINEMLRQINAESEAKQAKALHEIQLLKEIYQLKNIGNY